MPQLSVSFIGSTVANGRLGLGEGHGHPWLCLDECTCTFDMYVAFEHGTGEPVTTTCSFPSMP